MSTGRGLAGGGQLSIAVAVGVLQLTGGNRGQGRRHRLAGGLVPDERVQRRDYHWVSSRNTGWKATGEAAGRRCTRFMYPSAAA